MHTKRSAFKIQLGKSVNAFLMFEFCHECGPSSVRSLEHLRRLCRHGPISAADCSWWIGGEHSNLSAQCPDGAGFKSAKLFGKASEPLTETGQKPRQMRVGKGTCPGFVRVLRALCRVWRSHMCCAFRVRRLSRTSVADNIPCRAEAHRFVSSDVFGTFYERLVGDNWPVAVQQCLHDLCMVRTSETSGVQSVADCSNSQLGDRFL